MKAAIYKSLFLAILFSVPSVHAEVISSISTVQFETPCVHQAESGSAALQACDMTVASFQKVSQNPAGQTYAQSSEAINETASPVSEPNTAALMVLGFGVLSMVAGAKLKNS